MSTLTKVSERIVRLEPTSSGNLKDFPGEDLAALKAIQPFPKRKLSDVQIEYSSEVKKTFHVFQRAVESSDFSFYEIYSKDEIESISTKGKTVASFVALLADLNDTYFLSLVTRIGQFNKYLSMENVARSSTREVSILRIESDSLVPHEVLMIKKSGKYRIYDIAKPQGAYAEFKDQAEAIKQAVIAIFPKPAITIHSKL